jgi:acyl dehydratase
MRAERSLTLTADLIRAYSRRGNYHSDDDEAERLGLPGLVAQGMQVAAPAYATVLDAWGTAFLERGVVELKFVGMVLENQRADAVVHVDDAQATFEVTNAATGSTAVVGTARLAPA